MGKRETGGNARGGGYFAEMDMADSQDHAGNAFLVLFVSVLAGTFSVFTLLMWTVIVQTDKIHFIASVLMPSACLSALSGYPAINRYRLKDTPRFCRTAFAAAFLGLLPASLLALWQIENKYPEAGFGTGIMPFWGVQSCILGYIVMYIMAQRTRYLLSGKTNNWLQSYAAQTRMASLPGELARDPETIQEVLQHMHPTQQRGNAYVPTLFLDTLPEGEHWLCLQKAYFRIFGLNITGWRALFFPVDWSQVGEIRARFGEFRKTAFISRLACGNQTRNLPGPDEAERRFS